MTIRYLLDTNIASDILRARNATINHKMLGFNKDDLAISVLTESELLYGLALQPEATRLKEQVESFLSDTRIYAWDSDAAAVFATLRAKTRRSGMTVATIDLQIAAHALALGATLVTRDTIFHDIPGLICEDWTRPRPA